MERIAERRAVCGPAKAPTAAATGPAVCSVRDPWRWGCGHGGALLRRVHELLAVDGHADALLWVAAANTAQSGSTHDGWTKDGQTQRAKVAGVTFDEVGRVRDLADGGHRDAPIAWMSNGQARATNSHGAWSSGVSDAYVVERILIRGVGGPQPGM